jgi:hypothetical protein
MMAGLLLAVALVGCGSTGDDADAGPSESTTTEPTTTTTDPAVAMRRYSSELGPTLDDLTETSEQIAACVPFELDPTCGSSLPIVILTASIEADLIQTTLKVLAEDGPPPAEIAELVDELDTASQGVIDGAQALEDGSCTYPISADCAPLFDYVTNAAKDVASVAEAWQPYR